MFLIYIYMNEWSRLDGAGSLVAAGSSSHSRRHTPAYHQGPSQKESGEASILISGICSRYPSFSHQGQWHKQRKQQRQQVRRQTPGGGVELPLLLDDGSAANIDDGYLGVASLATQQPPACLPVQLSSIHHSIHLPCPCRFIHYAHS
eukprot:GHVU01055510.1.p1 GENE.GHVU01055510.1~~GHVU01055510.1.p1  ORF type:complete len:147 (-),score=20.31 GHVU01055510.1:259-699(-)